MNLTVIDNHTIDADLIPIGSFVLDVGSRDYRFSYEMAERFGSVILALDPDPTVRLPSHPNISLCPFALVGLKESRHQNLVMTRDVEARYLVELNKATQWPQVPIRTITLAELIEMYHVKLFDVIKLNCEGMEYGILEDIEGPIATQISVSFHEHAAYPKGRQAIDRLIKKLENWYTVIQHVWEPRYCSHANYWDTLLVAK